ncbi:MAG: hypothetical protein RL368_2453 [Pseudomonadota bacterium]|jgi:hypothetical protein
MNILKKLAFILSLSLSVVLIGKVLLPHPLIASAKNYYSVIESINSRSISTSLMLFWIVFSLFVLWIGVRYIRLYNDPLINYILNNLKRLLVEVPITELEKVSIHLDKINQLEKVLEYNKSSRESLNSAIRFAKHSANIPVCIEELQKKIGYRDYSNTKRIQSTVVRSQNPRLVQLKLNANCPLPFSELYIFFPKPKQTASQLIDFLVNHVLFDITLVITLDPKQQAQFKALRTDKSTNIVIFSLPELTELFLAENSLVVLTGICAKQLNLAHVSPYQLFAGINRSINFFGRHSIIKQIMTPPLKNYLVCGGRLLGKSSLLKAVERAYQSHPRIKCYYLVLAGDKLVSEMAYALGLSHQASIDDVIIKIRQASNEQYLFLIDEVDSFIKADRERNYLICRHLLSISQTETCHFILTGFWELYQSIFYEPLSPLKNFGDFIQLAELEEDACRKLTTVPMSWLNIKYQPHNIHDKIIKMVGQRANLVAMVCHAILKKMPDQEMLILEEHIEKAFLYPDVIDSLGLGSFSSFVDNEDDARLDRIVIYLCFLKQNEIKYEVLKKFLDDTNYPYHSTQLQKSLMRLALTYVLKRDDLSFTYSFCVPLFPKLLERYEIPTRLREEFEQLSLVLPEIF